MESNCILFAGGKTTKGYGVVSRNFGQGKQTKLAHRIAYEEAHGPIPPGMLVMHTCDTPACINPAHLRLGTYQDNYDDMRNKGRASKAHGEAHYNTTLREEDVLEIRSQYDAGLPRNEIADAFGLSRQAVTDIGKRRTWKHVKPSDWKAPDIAAIIYPYEPEPK